MISGRQIFDTLTKHQQDVIYGWIGAILEGAPESDFEVMKKEYARVTLGELNPMQLKLVTKLEEHAVEEHNRRRERGEV